MKKLLLLLLILSGGTLASFAAEIDGKWKTTMTPPGGGEGMEITFTFKTDGEKLSGTVDTQMNEIEFTNGKINGKEFSFDVDVNGMIIKHKCTINGDTIKMKIEGFGGPDGGQEGPGEMILTREK
jgi:hypothetical protein